MTKLPPGTDYLVSLRKHSLFSALSRAQFTKLTAHVEALTLYNQQVLFRHGQTADRFFMVLRGHLKLFRIGPDQTARVIEIIGPQQTFGEALMFLKKPTYPVNAQALEDCLLVSIPNQHYMVLLREEPRSCFQLLAKLSEHLHQRINEIENLTLQNTTARVGRYLVNLMLLNNEQNDKITLHAPKRVIASQLGMKPETFSRVLATLSQQNVLSVKGPEITILDQARLRNYAGRNSVHRSK